VSYFFFIELPEQVRIWFDKLSLKLNLLFQIIFKFSPRLVKDPDANIATGHLGV